MIRRLLYFLLLPAFSLFSGCRKDEPLSPGSGYEQVSYTTSFRYIFQESDSSLQAEAHFTRCSSLYGNSTYIPDTADVRFNGLHGLRNALAGMIYWTAPAPIDLQISATTPDRQLYQYSFLAADTNGIRFPAGFTGYHLLAGDSLPIIGPPVQPGEVAWMTVTQGSTTRPTGGYNGPGSTWIHFAASSIQGIQPGNATAILYRQKNIHIPAQNGNAPVDIRIMTVSPPLPIMLSN